MELLKRKKDIINYINDLLIRYTSDEVGSDEGKKYLRMNKKDKINLYYNALDMNKDPEDLETDIIINFNYWNY